MRPPPPPPFTYTQGLLSMANMGPNTNTAHFSIMMGPAPHLDGHYTIFGQAVTGFEVRAVAAEETLQRQGAMAVGVRPPRLAGAALCCVVRGWRPPSLRRAPRPPPPPTLPCHPAAPACAALPDRAPPRRSGTKLLPACITLTGTGIGWRPCHLPQVIDAINALSKGKPENTATGEDGVMIVDSGQLRKGTLVPDLDLGDRGAAAVQAAVAQQ